MKLKIDRKVLRDGVKTVGRAVNTRTVLPILSNIKITAKDGAIKLTATDLEIGITCWIDGYIEEEGETTVPARTFIDLANVSSEGNEFKLNLLKGWTLKMECGNVSSRVKGIDPAEFPLTYEGEEGEGVTFEAADLIEMINHTAFAAATDESRPILNGVHFEFDEEEFRMSAVDGFRLSRRIAPIPNGAMPEATKAIVPAKALNELARILGKRDKVEMFIQDSRAIFRADDLVLVTQLIDGTFPDVEEIIPQIHTTRAILSAEKMLKSCQAAHVFARDAHNLVKISVDPEGKMSISAIAAEIGSNETAIGPQEVEGEGLEIGFNVQYMMDLLKLKVGEMMIFETNGSDKPGVFKFQGRDDFLHILMPMHIAK